MTTASTLPVREIVSDRSNGSKIERYQSWGRYPKAAHRNVSKIYWRDQLEEALRKAEPESLLAYGMGRSYGDSCLNSDRDLLDCKALNRILDCDWEAGRVCVEAGITLGDLLEVIVPRGWFMPVVPGTKFVTVGGAIANDIHGKNHHRAGTFGCHVKQITLHRSDTSPVVCSPATNSDLLQATIGGLGLTGVIGSAEIQLKRIAGNAIEVETLTFRDLNQFLDLSAASDQSHEYTVAWVDCLSRGGRGIFFRGSHAEKNVSCRSTKITVPFAFPEFGLNRPAVKLFNRAYFGLKARKPGSAVIHYDPFFFPLDSILNWNLLYGRRGLVQYQCVLPAGDAGAVKTIIEAVSKSGEACFLAVLKAFGEIQSPGLLSFPRPGLTLALDLPMRGNRTLALLSRLDELVLANGGALYPAKDARMSSTMFKSGFPNWASLVPYIDPKFSSSFWRRATAE
ncbi:MAG TPA: FAD-binding oxidoreductase [Terriglobales bacterium]|jgi:FAD/FMN-containing dehydrogenase|nr:FAD-binding oxidoreductase [Terriglobales bacterium]